MITSNATGPKFVSLVQAIFRVSDVKLLVWELCCGGRRVFLRGSLNSMCQDGAQPLPPNLVLFWCFLVVRSVLTTLPCQSETWMSWFWFVPKWKLAQENVPINQILLENRYCVWVCMCVHVLYILLFVTTVLLQVGLGGCNILSQLLTYPSGVNSHTGPQASWGQCHAYLVLCFSSSAWHRVCACA